VIVRPTITYGVGDHGFPYSLIRLVDTGLFVHCSRDVQIHIGDVQVLVEAFLQAGQVDVPSGSAYIVGDREPVSMRALVGMISLHLKGRTYPRWKTLPGAVFDLAHVGFDKLLRSDAWKTRIELLSRNWSYDAGPAQRDLELDLASTLDRFSYVVEWYLASKET
jgi:nucleoside-diphosphate-sugar epimerase